MHATAYDRARKLWTPRQGAVLWSRLLGVVHSLLILKAILIAGVLAALVTSRGEAWRVPFTAEEAVEWKAIPIASRSDGQILYDNTGLYPIVAANEISTNFGHRLVARSMKFLMARLPPLRNNRGALTSLLAVGLAIFFALSLVSQWRRRSIAEASQESANALRRQIHRQLYRLGQSSLPSEGTGPVMNLFTREVNDIREGLAAELNHHDRVPVLLAGLLIFSLAISWNVTFFLASLAGLTWLVVRYLNRSAELASVLATREAALQLCLLQEDFGLIRTVRVHGVENYDKQRFDEHLERHRDAEIRRVLNESRTSPTATLLICAAGTIAVGLMAQRVITENETPASAILLFFVLVAMVRPSMDWLSMKRSLRQASRSAEGVFAYLEQKPELHQTGGAKFLAPIKERISFENITLENGSGRVLFDGLTIEIPARSKTVIMGLDEEAKTALVCMIPRLIDPKVGRVRVDGVDLRDVTLESVRAQVAMVLQADLVFSDSVVANIALGDVSYDLPRIIDAAKVAHAHNFIQELPNGYDTVIGPLGVYLKPDQQFRIALARAFLHNPSIMIIEEPDARLDEDTRSFIDDTVARLAPGRTLIMLPHRLSTIRTSDRVIVLHNGRVEASGTPSEIKAAKLFRHLQYVEFNQFAAGEIEAGQMGG